MNRFGEVCIKVSVDQIAVPIIEIVDQPNGIFMPRFIVDDVKNAISDTKETSHIFARQMRNRHSDEFFRMGLAQFLSQVAR